jgi:hypothetical protein
MDGILERIKDFDDMFRERGMIMESLKYTVEMIGIWWCMTNE